MIKIKLTNQIQLPRFRAVIYCIGGQLTYLAIPLRTEQFAGVGSYLVRQIIYPAVDHCSSKRLWSYNIAGSDLRFASASSMSTEALRQ